METSATMVDELHRALVERLEQRGDTELSPEYLRQEADLLAQSGVLAISDADRGRVVRDVVDRMVGWGPLTPLLADPAISEIMVNGMHSLYVERDGQLERIPHVFSGTDELRHVIQRMVATVGRRIDTSSPLVDARLADGSRVNAIIEPLSLIGPVLTIRRFPERPLTLEELVRRGTIDVTVAAFLRTAILARLNIVISGGTGSGKTTTLNVLASCIPETERLVTIEDAAELKLTHPHLVSLESRPPNIEGAGEIPARILLKNALRMRPDRIIIGEVRGGEALDMLQAMNTGHQGSLTTVHANAPLEALLRIETMALMSDLELPLFAIRQQIRQAIHIILHQERMRSGKRALLAVSYLHDVAETDGGYRVTPLFFRDHDETPWTLAPVPEQLVRRLAPMKHL